MRYQRETGGQNLYAIDTNARSRLREIDAEEFAIRDPLLHDFGGWVGETVEAEAAYTDRHGRPTLGSYDRDGGAVNTISGNPGWDAASREVYQRGVVGLNYGAAPAPFTTTFAMGYLLSQADVSLHCPVTMTGAVAYVLDRFAPEPVRERYLPELIRTDGQALTGGTWATELHGGSDVGATTTTARAEGDGLRLDGLKWFASNPLGGLALATARPDPAVLGARGLGLYLVPLTLPEGTPNPMRLRRLKDKLGTCGVPTAEIELTGTWAVEVAPPPLGLRVMMEALGFSRIHNAMASVGLSRRAFLEAVSYLSHREAFGAHVTGFPMVQQELIELVVRLEADFELALVAAMAFDKGAPDRGALDSAAPDNSAQTWSRLVTALAKYQTAENANVACRSAIELIGGNAYTYDLITPRLLRDAQVTTVWEGPANIQALELQRVLGAPHDGFRLFEQRVEAIRASAPLALGDIADAVGAAVAECRAAVALMAQDGDAARHHARRLMALMAETLAAALLLDNATARLAEGDARKATVARLYIEQRLAPPPRRGIVEGGHWGCRYFDALIGYEPIPAAEDRARPLRAATA